jgi:nanoRNase/pAp phosphatase (c-di-AMP/oligoRNAs hydrolase)
MQPPAAFQRELGRLSALGAEVEGLVREQPELLAAALAVLVVLGAAALGVRRLLEPPGRTFARALSRKDAVTVLTHPNPDPDAMASALGVKLIAERQGTEATIQHPGGIRHQENRAFETVLGFEAERVDYLADIEHEDVVLVDHGEPRGFDGSDRIQPYAVVDHHPDGGEGTAFTDVRPEAGACASIVAGYLEELEFTPAEPGEYPGEDDVPPEVATGLAYGIQADTADLTRGCTALEFDASEYLMPGIDPDRMERIANPVVSADTLEVKARAITNRVVEGAHAVSDVGEVENPDAIPQAADELLTLEGVDAVVVVGQHGGELRLSGRSQDDRVHMGKALDAAVDSIHEDAEGGGHARMGGGQVPTAALRQVSADGAGRSEYARGLGAGLEPGPEASGAVPPELTERLFEVLGGER